MMHWILTLSLLVLTTPAQASDDIKSFVQYKHQRLRTYEDAVAHHNQTKDKVYVWVDVPDDDVALDRWSQTKSLGYHVFVKDFEGTKKGLVIGAEIKGAFRQSKVIKWDDPTFLKEAGVTPVKPKKSLFNWRAQSDPSDSTCYVWRRGRLSGDAGTGTVIACEGGKSLVLTNAHVIEGRSDPIVIMQGSRELKGTLLANGRANGLDLALIVAEGEMTPAPIAKTLPKADDPIRMWGFGGTKFTFPDGVLTVTPKLKSGTFVETRGQDSYTRMNTISGDSGSGWFNDAGELVAVHWGNPGGMARGVPLNKVWSFVKGRTKEKFPELYNGLPDVKEEPVVVTTTTMQPYCPT